MKPGTVPWTGMAAILGGAIWSLSWVMNAFTQDGTRAVLGLSEPGWTWASSITRANPC